MELIKDFSQRIDVSRTRGRTDTDILNDLSKRNSDLKNVIDNLRQKASTSNKSDREVLNYLSEKIGGQSPTVESVAKKNTNTDEKYEKRGVLQKVGDTLLGPAMPFTGLFDKEKTRSEKVYEGAKDFATTFVKPIGEVVASVYEATGSEAPKWTEDKRLMTPELRAWADQGYSIPKTEEQKKLFLNTVSAAKESGAQGATFGDIINALSVLPSGSAKVIAEKIPGGSKLTGSLSKLLKNLGGKTKTQAEKKLTEALSPTTKENKRKVEKILSELFNKDVKGTLGQIKNKAQSSLKSTGAAIGETIGEISAKGQTTKTKPILDVLEKYKTKYMVGDNVVEPQAVKAVDDVMEIIKKQGEEVSSDSLIRLKQIWDKQIAKRKGFEKFADEITSFSLEAKKEATDVIRNILAKENPSLAELNKEYSFWKNVDDVVTATTERKKSQTGGLVRGLGEITGAIAGSSGGLKGSILGGILGRTLSGLFSGTLWKSVSAQNKMKLANLLMEGNPQAIVNFLKGLGVTVNLSTQD